MRKDKNIVFELRKQGKSYRTIQQATGISRSTLSAWFRNIEWSSHIKTVNRDENSTANKVQLERMHIARMKLLDSKYEKAIKEAEEEWLIFKNEPYFMAGLMVYAGEGDKRNRHLIRISNTDFYLHNVFITFVEKYLGKTRENIKFGLIVYPDNDINTCEERWSKEVRISRDNFHKTQVIQGKETKRKLQFGVGMSILSSTVLKKKLMRWLELCADEFS